MSLMFSCDDKATLVAYLYDEIDADDRQRVDEHLKQCAACAAEVGALAGVRTGLTQWAPPNVELGFTIVRAGAEPAAAPQPAAAVPGPPPWWNTVPVWAQAVAAIFVLAVSAAVANVQVKSGPDGLAISTGWMTPAASTMAPPEAPLAATDEQWKPALTALEQQLREEIRATRETGTVRAASRSSDGDEPTLRRVRELLAASESRQNRELALRVTQLTRDMNIQRRADLLRVEQAIGHTSVEMAKQRQTVNYLIRASTTPQQ
ncbi:MAG: zf-HC2 domain-containing protein [Acidobacteriota bacterium]|nr:zf-HC2 domain-containing protein [Acidobacteriota bacterium]